MSIGSVACTTEGRVVETSTCVFAGKKVCVITLAYGVSAITKEERREKKNDSKNRNLVAFKK